MILVIYGAGGFGREVAELAARNNNGRWEEIVFVVDVEIKSDLINGIPVYSYENLWDRFSKKDTEFVIAIGEPLVRAAIYGKLKSDGCMMGTLIDETARVSGTSVIGEGSIICEFVMIHDSVVLGNNVVIQPFAVLGHDISVGSHSVLSAFCAPGGGCIFEECAYAGMHSTILEHIRIGRGAIVGMGAVVYKDVAPDMTVIGNPARVTKGREDHKVFHGQS